jgi:translation initiation factor 3 subunit A
MPVVFQARRHKTWSKTHEQIMLKHVELCVALRKPHVAKDALFQYKALTQQVRVLGDEMSWERSCLFDITSSVSTPDFVL